MSVVISVHKEYLDKKGCLDKARDLIKRRQILKMNELECAKEIYAHTVMYYISLYLLKNFGIMLYYILKHSYFVDLENGGDKVWRKFMYSLIWIFPFSQKTIHKINNF